MADFDNLANEPSERLPNEEPIWHKMKKQFKEFCQSTTLHGYSYLYITEQTNYKWIWGIMIFIMNGLAIYFLGSTLFEYVHSGLRLDIESSSANLSVRCHNISTLQSVASSIF